MSSKQKQAQYRGTNFEYRVAKLVNGKRVGRSQAIVVGNSTIQIDPNHPPDVVNEWSSIECKYVKSLPKAVTKAMAQVLRNTALTKAPRPLVPVIFMGDRAGNRVVIMPENVYLELHEGG